MRIHEEGVGEAPTMTAVVRLQCGSGLAVTDSGIATNHHFLPPSDGTPFRLLAGVHTVDVFASLVGDRMPRLLYSTQLELSDSHGDALQDPTYGVYFDWGPDAGKYHALVRSHPEPPAVQDVIE